MACKTIFLVSAQLQNGKDAFGAELALAVEGVCVAFATPLKEIAILLGMPREIAYGGEEERRGWFKYLKALDKQADAREWLQWIGTEFGRDQIHESVWVGLLLDDVATGLHRAYVVTDARFKNELGPNIEQMAKDRGMDVKFVRIRVKRPKMKSTETHKSETEQLSIPDNAFDFLVKNNSTLEALMEQAWIVAGRCGY